MDTNYTVQTESLFGNPNLSDEEREDRHRTIPIANGNKIHLRAQDPFGFVKISFDKGPTPVVLQGAWTSFIEAERAVKSWQTVKAQEVDQAVEASKKNARFSPYGKVKLTPRVPVDDKTDKS